VSVNVPGVRIQAKEKSANKRGGVNEEAHYFKSLVWIAAAAKETRTKAAPKVKAKTGAGIEVKNCIFVCVCLFNWCKYRTKVLPTKQNAEKFRKKVPRPAALYMYARAYAPPDRARRAASRRTGSGSGARRIEGTTPNKTTTIHHRTGCSAHTTTGRRPDPHHTTTTHHHRTGSGSTTTGRGPAWFPGPDPARQICTAPAARPTSPKR